MSEEEIVPIKNLPLKLSILIAVLGIIGVVIWPIFQVPRSYSGPGRLSGIRQLVFATLAYADKWDEHLAPACSWMDASQPYAKGSNPFRSRQLPPETAGYGFAFDCRLDQVAISTINSPQTTYTIYDSSSLQRNASDPATSLPNPGRHKGQGRGNNGVAFADGHVKLVPAKEE